MNYDVTVSCEFLLTGAESEADIIEAVREWIEEHGIEIYAAAHGIPEDEDSETLEEYLDRNPTLEWYPFEGIHSGSN
jgi:hypothetical protein